MGVEILPFQEFMNACSLIEMHQIFSLKGKDFTSKVRANKISHKKLPRKIRILIRIFLQVTLKWDADEMFKALSKETLFGDILNGY